MFSGDSPSDNNDREGAEKKDNKKEKDKGYVAFHSDDSSHHESDNEEEEETAKSKSKKSKKDRPSTLRLRIKSKTKKKKDKDKEKEKEKEKEKDKNKKKQKKSDSAPPAPPSAPVFGVPLSVAVKRSKFLDNVELPKIARECIMYMEDHGLTQEGIYRISGSKTKIDGLKDLYNRGLEINLDEYDVYTIGSLLKMFLRELPDNILVQISRFEELVVVKDQNEKIQRFKQLLSELPPCNYTLMSWLMVHMSHVVQKCSENKMSVQNIIIVLSPTLSVHHHGILYFILNNVNALFPDTKLTRYTVPVLSPIAPLAEEDDPILPSSPESIEVELLKREAFLAKLHEDLKANESEDEKETKAEQLWEIQRTVTLLKRKLRKAHRASDLNTAVEEKKSEEDDQETKQLLASEMELIFEQEELNMVTSKLRQLIENEKNEILRLKGEITSRTERKESVTVFSDHGSDSESDSESENEEELEELNNDLIKQNEELEKNNNELCQSLHSERQACIQIRVQIKKLKQQQEKSKQDQPQSQDKK